LLKNTGTVLFIDAGSNLGQGCKFFSFFYRGNNFIFELFEPNENCQKALKKLCEQKGKNFSLNCCAISTKNDILDFYGTDESEGGLTSEGGSLDEKHNSGIYHFSNRKIVKVRAIDFKEYLLSANQLYEKIIIKMDIEGAEIDVLEDLIESDVIDAISILYIEFHAVYKNEPDKSLYLKREKSILQQLKINYPEIKVRIWH
jgi:FkbM family methyltransferase